MHPNATIFVHASIEKTGNCHFDNSSLEKLIL